MTDRTVLQAWVPGLPKTKGSMTHIGGGHMAESVIGSARWRILMVERFKSDTTWRGVTPIIGPGMPVHVSAEFSLPVDPTSVGSGDIDKLLRNVLDALSACTKKCGPRCKKHAGIYVDDVQVVSSNIAKKRADESGPGVYVTVKWITSQSS